MGKQWRTGYKRSVPACKVFIFHFYLSLQPPGKGVDQVCRGQWAITLDSDLAAHNLVRISLAWPQWKCVEYRGIGEEPFIG